MRRNEFLSRHKLFSSAVPDSAVFQEPGITGVYAVFPFATNYLLAFVISLRSCLHS